MSIVISFPGSVTSGAMLGILFLLHFFADFNLQIGAGLDKLKQWRWWREQIPEKDESAWKQYKDDYKVALWCHSFQWSLVTCLPLVMCGGTAYLVNAFVHGGIHYAIDDMKANQLTLNLKCDQAIHALQVVCMWGAWMIL